MFIPIFLSCDDMTQDKYVCVRPAVLTLTGEDVRHADNSCHAYHSPEELEMHDVKPASQRLLPRPDTTPEDTPSHFGLGVVPPPPPLSFHTQTFQLPPILSYSRLDCLRMSTSTESFLHRYAIAVTMWD